jgi:acyl-coenzyme A synthetase/AMP-(fatty) acid ligase
VPPAELEACLGSHPAIADAAVIPVPDMAAGEVPKAFVVLKKHSVASSEAPILEPTRDILEHVRARKAAYKWLTGGVEYVDAIPKSPSGKILRRFLRDREREKRRAEGARI